jgi:hypothetical protein
MHQKWLFVVAFSTAILPAASSFAQAPAKVKNPSLLAGKILTPSIDVTKAPGLPEVQLTFRAGTNGFGSAIVTLSSPSSLHSASTNIGFPAYPPDPSRAVVKTLLQLSSGFNTPTLYLPAGNWSISQITIFTPNVFPPITYSGTQLAALFPQGTIITVANPNTPDVKPPVAGDGTIVTPTVSLSSSNPYAVVKMKARDDVSGIVSGGVTFIGPSGAGEFSVYTSLGAPIKSGTLVESSPLSSTQATGTYVINGFYVCDYAGNCLNDNNPADINEHFSSTMITVTN